MNRVLAFAIVLAACNGSTGSSPCADLGGDMGTVACVIAPSGLVTRSACSDPATLGAFCDGSGDTAPNLACLAPIDAGASSGPVTDRITVTGFVNVFASGADTNHVNVSVFTASSLSNGADPATLTPVEHDDVCFYFSDTPTPPASCTLATANDLVACDTDATVGCVTPKVDGCDAECNDGLMGRRDKQQYCHPTTDGVGACRPRARWQLRYTLAQVPADQEVVIRVSGVDGAPDAHFQTTVTPDVVVTKSRVCADVTKTDCYDPAANVYRRDVLAMSRFDYSAIAQRSGLNAGITPGHGAILGEVHDCDGVRLGNAQVVTVPTPARSTYFSDTIPFAPSPDVTRAAKGTDARGLYGQLDLAPGLVTVTPWGFLSSDGPLERLGERTVRVYPDAYTLVDIGGGRP